MKSNSFGKRNTAVARLPAARPAVVGVKALPEAPIDSEYRDPAYAQLVEDARNFASGLSTSAPNTGGLPFLTFALIALLTFIYGWETSVTQESDLSVLSYIKLGGMSHNLVFVNHQWWRIFTAPFLHGSAGHLIGNAVALLAAGYALERNIGARWFACVYMVSALAGSLVSVMNDDPNIVGVGASGAIMGVLACAIICRFRIETPGTRSRAQKLSTFFVVSAIAPVIFPSLGDPRVDLAAHLGGAVAGGLMGVLLCEVFSSGQKTPAYAQSAFAVASVMLAISGTGFLLNSEASAAAPAGSPAAILIAPNELPGTPEEQERRSADLVQRYPLDPRSHLFRALAFLKQQDSVAAARELHAAMDNRKNMTDSPAFETRIKAGLAIVYALQGRIAEAKDLAQNVCTSDDDDLSDVRENLDGMGICR